MGGYGSLGGMFSEAHYKKKRIIVVLGPDFGNGRIPKFNRARVSIIALQGTEGSHFTKFECHCRCAFLYFQVQFGFFFLLERTIPGKSINRS